MILESDIRRRIAIDPSCVRVVGRGWGGVLGSDWSAAAVVAAAAAAVVAAAAAVVVAAAAAAAAVVVAVIGRRRRLAADQTNLMISGC